MATNFFPGVTFAWTFTLALLSLLAVASYTDQRWMVIPKWLTLTMLPLGLVFNLLRGAWLASLGEPVWQWAGGSAATGALDGVLFGLAGFGLMFLVFLLLWILGTCGGGDLKLFAAMGAWLGPTVSVGVLAASLVVVLLLSVFKGLTATFRRGVVRTAQNLTAPVRKKGKSPDPKSRWMSYSLPLTLATAVVLLWVFRVELQLSAPRSVGEGRAQHHAS